MSGVSPTQAPLTSAITLLGNLVAQKWQGRRDRLSDERALRDTRSERMRHLLGDTIALLEDGRDIQRRRCPDAPPAPPSP